MYSTENPLARLHADIEARVEAIREQQPAWRCCKGCSSCCRRLAEIPQLTAPEWDLLRAGLAILPRHRLHAISEDVATLAARQSGPIICPLLDHRTNACLVYAQRPVACRTFGFFVQRDLGLYCRDIESLVATGALAQVVWGNHDAIDRRLAGLGQPRALTEWFDAVITWEIA